MSDHRKLAGVVDIASGAIMVFVFGGVFTRNDDPELLKAIPDLHTIGYVGAAIGAAILLLGILILRRVRIAALISIGVFAAVAAFAVYATASGYLESGKQGPGYALAVMSLVGAVAQYQAWEQLKR